LRLIEAAGRTDIPVQGVACYNFTEPTYAPGSRRCREHGRPTTLPQRRHAVLEFIDRVLAAPGEITVVALGRLTNLALAISIEPQVATLRSLTYGGAIAVTGNITPVASANLWVRSADVVYRLVPRSCRSPDVCDQVEISAAHSSTFKRTLQRPGSCRCSPMLSQL
jgi:inosine-uridine nucleoside N-ribohydrolase